MIKEHNVTDLTIRAGRDQTTVSRHLATLVNSEIISQKRIGRNIFYKIINSEMKEWLNSAINVQNKNYEKKELRNKIEDFLKKQRVKNE